VFALPRKAESTEAAESDYPRTGLHCCLVSIDSNRYSVPWRGRILGAVPKSFLPNYREYYENRWFAPGAGVTGVEVSLAGQTVPFGVDIVFAATDLPSFVFHLEICEDFWSASPPSTQGALAGVDPVQSIRVEHRGRQSGGSRAPVRIAVDALPGGICLLGRRVGGKHDRSRMGWPGDGSRDGRAAMPDRASG
jgi:predicted amidohydrolase